jgi:hypothetical protein
MSWSNSYNVLNLCIKKTLEIGIIQSLYVFILANIIMDNEYGKNVIKKIFCISYMDNLLRS